MDRKKPKSLSVNDARTRLKEVAAQDPVEDWIQDHPKKTVLFAVFLGLVAGRFPSTRKKLFSVIEKIL